MEQLKTALLGEAEMRPASVQQYVKNLKTFLRWCRDSGFQVAEGVLEVGVLEVENVDLGPRRTSSTWQAEPTRGERTATAPPGSARQRDDWPGELPLP